MALDKKYIPANWHLNSDGSYDVDGDVDDLQSYVEEGKLVVRFRNISGNFDCSNIGLVTLAGCPEKVDGSFICEGNMLTSLTGAPKIVGESFNCSYNKLKSLIGGPVKVGWHMGVSWNNLETLEGSPRIIDGWFTCEHNPLKTLRGGPEKVRFLFCTYTDITSLDGAPYISKGVTLYHNKLTTLRGIQEEIDGNFNCAYNRLKSLQYGPKRVNGAFYCDNNYLKDLRGAPRWVGDDFQCHENLYLYDYTWIPEYIKGEIKFSHAELIKSKAIGDKYIKASMLPVFKHNYDSLNGVKVDWDGFRRRISSFKSWIPRTNVKHINLTSKMARELYMTQILEV